MSTDLQRRKNKNFLRPLTGEPRPFHFITADIEANSWTKFAMAGVFDGDKFFKFDTLESFVDYCLNTRKIRNHTIYLHAGGIYDFSFILAELRRRGEKVKLVCQGPRITQINVKTKNKRRCIFRDSFAILNSSLDKLSKAFDVENKKLTGSINFETEIVNPNNPLHVKYLKNDCMALHQVLRKFFSMPRIHSSGIGMTTAAQAMLCFRRHMKKPVRVSSDEVQKFCRDSYFGGRVEIFKQYGNKLNLYDVNSLFPSAMLKPLPIEYIQDVSDFGEFGFYDLELKAPDMYIPVLPMKIENKLIFPTGDIKGVFFSEEIKAALSCDYKITKFNRGMEFSKSSEFFSDYVNYWYKVRQENPGNNPKNFTAKLLLNSLYGKFGQREERTTLVTYDGQEEFSMWHSEDAFKLTGLVEIKSHHRAAHQLVHIASAITSYARLTMLPFYHAYENELFYTDTDSLFTNAELPTSDNLGELKLEKSNLECFFRLPKTYAMRQGEKLEIKAKGFPKKYLDNVTWENFKSSELEYTRKVFAKFRTSVIRENKYLSMVEVKKRLKAKYNKRVLLPNNDTAPLNIKNGVIQWDYQDKIIQSQRDENQNTM